MSQENWKVVYYLTQTGKNPISDFLDELTKRQQTKILKVFRFVRKYGLDSVIPHLKKLVGTPLWEIRIQGKDNIRILYVVPMRSKILILHGFFKKSQKTLTKDIRTALSRLEIYKNQNIKFEIEARL